MLWIKEVEMVESVDDLKSSCSVIGFQMPSFEVLDAKIASALNRIIHNTQFKRKVSLEEQKAPKKRTRFLRGRQIAYLIYEYFPVTGAIYYCSPKCWYSGIRFETGRNFIINDENPIWWHLGRIVQIKNTRVGETQDRIGINCTIWRFTRRKQDLIITDWRQWWKEVPSRIYESRILMPETETMKKKKNAVVKNQGTQQRGQRILGNCWQWETNAQCSKGNNCSFRHDIKSVQNRHSRILLRALLRDRMREMHREPEVPEAEAQVEECFDCPARVTSKELAPIHSVKNGILQCACSTRMPIWGKVLLRAPLGWRTA